MLHAGRNYAKTALLLGLLSGQIALDNVAEIIGRRVVRRDVGSVNGYCENRGREQKER